MKTTTFAGVALGLASAAVASAEYCPAPAPTYGSAGAPTWTQLTGPSSLPGVAGAGEPTIGIPFNTDSVFFQAFANTYRITFDDDDNDTWDDVTPFNSVTNVDPMLHADPFTGRVWAGGLAGPCSVMAFSDDDGASWIPTGNMCTGAQFDHQSVGSGPYSTTFAGTVANPVYSSMTYYCSQLVLTACTFSLDGGLSWAPFTEILGGCGGLHGHIRVSPVTGIATVPDQSCGSGRQGFGYSVDNGLTWQSRTVDESISGPGGFDPAVSFSHESGWLYYAHSGSLGNYIALSKDEGLNWEVLGTKQTPFPAKWLNVGQFHEPAVVRGEWSDLQAGDDDRAAFSFFGLLDLDGDGTGAEYPDQNQCNDRQGEMIWDYFVAMTYDAGQSWNVQKTNSNPIQVGGLWDGGGGDPCRNLLDFQDMDIDSTGRVYVGFADGCIGDCDDFPAPNTPGYRSDYSSLIRQTTGRGLFAEFDNDDLEECPEPTQALPTGNTTFGATRQVTADEQRGIALDSCQTRCGSSVEAQAPAGCYCGADCASDDSLNCCADYAQVCLPSSSFFGAEAIEVTAQLTGSVHGAADFPRKRSHYRDVLAAHLGVSSHQVVFYQITAESVTVMVFPKNADRTLKLFRSSAFAAAVAADIDNGVQFAGVSARIVQVGEQDATVSAAAANTASASNTAASSGISAGSVAAIVAPVVAVSTAAAFAAGYLVHQRRSHKETIAALEQQQQV